MNANIKIVLRKRLNSDGTSSVTLRLTINRKLKVYSLNLTVHPKNWDTARSKVKSSDVQSFRKNKLIHKYHSKAQYIIDEFVFSDQVATIYDFDKKFSDKIYGNVDFYEFVRSELSKRTFSAQTLNTYSTQISKIERFKPTLTFAELTVSLIEGYKEYMITELNNKPNTYYKSLSMLKTFTNWAIEKKNIKVNNFKNFKIKKFVGKRDFLNSKEVSVLEQLFESNTLRSNLQNTLRYFLFVCYTGLRYTDIYDLKYHHIIEEKIKGKIVSVVSLSMHKTKRLVQIPLIPKAQNLLQEDVEKGEKVFRVYSNQQSNKFLKEIAVICNFNKNLTNHVGRYTFGSIGLENGIPLEFISKMLGHSSVDITYRIYTKTDNSMNYEQLMKLEH